MKIPSDRVLAATLLLVPVLAAGQPGGQEREAVNEWTGSGREEIDSLERHLEDAVGRVSLPHAGLLLGRANASRGYRLPGYGVVFVLTPRALPGEEPVFVVRRQAGPGAAAVHVERHGAHAGDEQHWVSEDVEELERQVLVLQHAAEARRREAEEDMDRIVEDVRVRLEVAGERGSPRPGEHDVTVHVDTEAPPPGASLSMSRRCPSRRGSSGSRRRRTRRTAHRIGWWRTCGRR